MNVTVTLPRRFIMDENDNVTSINTAKRTDSTTNGALLDMLPSQVRATIMGQYIESRALDHDANAFAKALEDRLLTTAVTSTFNVLKELINTPAQ